MKEIFDIIRAVNQLKDIIQRFSLKLDKLLKNPHNLNNNQFYDEETVCNLLHCSYRTVLRLRNSGFLPFIRVSRRVLYPISEVTKYLLSKKININSS
jgi:excisionase family DNA binding protein